MQLARPVIFALLLCARVLSAAADDYLQQIRRVELDPERCYRVRDVFLEREEIKLYFTDGHLIFGRKVHGRDIAVAFVSSEPADTGEALLIPPTPASGMPSPAFSMRPCSTKNSAPPCSSSPTIRPTR